MKLLILYLVMTITLCSEHGVKSTFTGNRKFAGKRVFCEYSHPISTGGVHKFWQECNE